jgi:hypothetical protein
MPGAVPVIHQVVILAVAWITRVCGISLDSGNAAQRQACGKQEGLKQCSGFHEGVSFLVSLMKQ